MDHGDMTLAELGSMVPVAAVAIITDSLGRYLIAKRAMKYPDGGRWEFPGGKVEGTENLRSTVRREIMEELGVILKNIRFYKSLLSKRKHGDFRLMFFFADLPDGQQPKAIDCETFCFTTFEQITKFDFYNPDILKQMHDDGVQ